MHRTFTALGLAMVIIAGVGLWLLDRGPDAGLERPPVHSGDGTAPPATDGRDGPEHPGSAGRDVVEPLPIEGTTPAGTDPPPETAPPGTTPPPPDRPLTGIAIQGTVVGPEGGPVEGAHLRWIPGSRSRTDVRSARSGADGAYFFEDVPARSGTLFVSHSDHLSVRVENVSPAGASGEVRLSRGGVIDCTVRRDGSPARGVVVRLRGPDVARTIRTGSSGRFTFGALPAGMHLVRVETPTDDGRNGTLLAEPIEVELAPEGSRTLVIDLDR